MAPAPYHSPPPPGKASSPGGNAFHMAGFDFTRNRDPMLGVNTLSNILQQRVFMPGGKNKNRGQRDSRLRFRVNLRIIMAAALHFGHFWGHEDFWIWVRRALYQFSSITKPEHLEDIVGIYCVAREEYCIAVSRGRYGHHQSDTDVPTPNIIAHLADQINRLPRCERSFVPKEDWEDRLSSWGRKLCDILFEEGCHNQQYRDGTCADELKDRPGPGPGLAARITTPSDRTDKYRPGTESPVLNLPKRPSFNSAPYNSEEFRSRTTGPEAFSTGPRTVTVDIRSAPTGPRSTSTSSTPTGPRTSSGDTELASTGLHIRGLSQKLNSASSTLSQSPGMEDRERDMKAHQDPSPRGISSKEFTPVEQGKSLKRPYDDAGDDGSAARAKRPAVDMTHASQPDTGLSKETPNEASNAEQHTVNINIVEDGHPCDPTPGEADARSTKCSTDAVAASEQSLDTRKPVVAVVGPNPPASVESGSDMVMRDALSDNTQLTTPPAEEDPDVKNEKSSTAGGISPCRVAVEMNSKINPKVGMTPKQAIDGDTVQELLVALERRQQMRFEKLEESMRTSQQQRDSDQAYIHKLEAKVDELEDLVVSYERVRSLKTSSLEEAVKNQEEQMGQHKTRIDSLTTSVSYNDKESQLVINASHAKHFEDIESQLKSLKGQQNSDADRIVVLEAEVDGLDTKLEAVDSTIKTRTADFEKAVKELQEFHGKEYLSQNRKIGDMKKQLLGIFREDQKAASQHFESTEATLKEVREQLDRRAPQGSLGNLEKNLGQAVEQLQGRASGIEGRVENAEKELGRIRSRLSQKTHAGSDTRNTENKTQDLQHVEDQICELREYVDHSVTMFTQANQTRMNQIEARVNDVQEKMTQRPVINVDTATAARLAEFESTLAEVKAQQRRSSAEAKKQPLSPSVSELESTHTPRGPSEAGSLQAVIGELEKVHSFMESSVLAMDAAGMPDTDEKYSVSDHAFALFEAIGYLKGSTKSNE